jgi:predicted short-subunit dehydrogenase-like oxidoreductase (DUF2520 family)
MMFKPSVAILGLGAVGQTLARRLHQSGYRLAYLYSRDASKAQDLANELDISSATFPSGDDSTFDILFLTVSDDTIAEVARQLADADLDLEGKTIVHCSGAKLSRLLDPVAQLGAQVAAFHPLQTFSVSADPAVFDGCYITIEGSESVHAQLKTIAESIGARPLVVTPEYKQHLHVAAVMACNYLVALLDAAEEIADSPEGADQPEPLELLKPLIQQTIRAVFERGTAQALSGPIARGDESTVAEHLELLEGQSSMDTLYRELGKHTVQLAAQGQKIEDSKVKRLLRLLEQ